MNYSKWHYSSSARVLLRMQIGQLVAVAVLGAYLIQLGKGRIVNSKPKFYFGKKISWGLGSRFFNFPKSETRYFIAKGGKQLDEMSLEDLRKLRVDPNWLIWRHGLDDWIKASELKELQGFVNYLSPPLPNIDLSEKEISKSGEKPNPIKIVNDIDWDKTAIIVIIIVLFLTVFTALIVM